eukprot:Skav226258  [mRNA]  locus=scaffold2708:96071:110597:- [translate_table: standard]
MKPATWHCSSKDQGRALLQKCRQITSSDRKQRLRQLLLQQETPALHDYLILRFGADPLLHEVMREDMLYGMVHRLDVGTTGSLLLAKKVESFRWAKEQIIRQALVRDYICLVHGTFAKNAKAYKPRGLIMAPIDKTHYEATRRCEVGPSGQHAATHYECLAEFKSKDHAGTTDGSQYSLLHCRLLTGAALGVVFAFVWFLHEDSSVPGDKQYFKKRPKHDPNLVCNRPCLHKAIAALQVPVLRCWPVTCLEELPDAQVWRNQLYLKAVKTAVSKAFHTAVSTRTLALDPDYLEEQKPGLSLRQQAHSEAVKPCDAMRFLREFSQEEFLVQAALKATSCVFIGRDSCTPNTVALPPWEEFLAEIDELDLLLDAKESIGHQKTFITH